jgi:uncharacterized protein YajQ (UPF0234 family)
MPSFDIVSNVNSMEIENAVHQARKELANRFDFKGSSAEIVLDKSEIKHSAEDQFKISALTEIVGPARQAEHQLEERRKAEPEISPRPRAAGHQDQTGPRSHRRQTDHGFIGEGKFKVTTQTR